MSTNFCKKNAPPITFFLNPRNYTPRYFTFWVAEPFLAVILYPENVNREGSVEQLDQVLAAMRRRIAGHQENRTTGTLRLTADLSLKQGGITGAKLTLAEITETILPGPPRR